MGERLSVNYAELLIELGTISMNISTGYSGCFLPFIFPKMYFLALPPKGLVNDYSGYSGW